MTHLPVKYTYGGVVMRLFHSSRGYHVQMVLKDFHGCDVHWYSEWCEDKADALKWGRARIDEHAKVGV